MASTINVNQNNNTITLNDQNRSIAITDNKTSNTVNVNQPVTRVVTVSTPGPQGPRGLQGLVGPTGERGTRESSSISWTEITDAPKVVDFIGDVAPNQLAIFADTFAGALPTNLPFSLPLEPEGDGIPTIQGLSGLTYDGSTFNIEGTVKANYFSGSFIGVATSAVSATSANTIYINNVSNDTSFGLVFRDGNFNGVQTLYADSQNDTPSWNPGSNTFTSPTISGSTVYADDLRLDYDALPTSDPRVRGQVWRNGTDLKISAG
jgi:hypothetical protein